MSKKKLSFKVGHGLAVTGLALSFGTGCPKEKPIVNTVPVEDSTNNQAPPDVKVNVVESPPATNNETNNATNNATNAGTAAGNTDGLKKQIEPVNVNTPPPQDDKP